jgi:hypothetical protein
LLLVLSLFSLTVAANNAHAGNCDTHSTDKKVKGSGI